MRNQPQMKERKNISRRFSQRRALLGYFVFDGGGGLTEHDVAVEHRLPLLLDLPPPPLLSVLHFVKHVGSGVRPRQNVVSVGKRLLVLKTRWAKTRFTCRSSCKIGFRLPTFIPANFKPPPPFFFF